MTKIYRGAGGKFASKAEIAIQKAAEAQPATSTATEEQPAPREEIIAYKGFNVNDKGELFCKNHTFEVGKEYDLTGTKSMWGKPITKAKLCETGFHACENPFDMFTYYPFQENRAYGRVTLFGNITRPASYDPADKIAGLGIRVDEQYNIFRLINMLAKFARDNPNKHPFKGSVDLNQTTSCAPFQIATLYAGRFMNSTRSDQGMQMSMIPGTRMVGSWGTTQIAAKENSTLIGEKNSVQYSYGDICTHVLPQGGTAIVKGNNSQIIAAGRVTFRGPVGTQVSIAESKDNYGRTLPAFSGVIGENGIPPNTPITYQAEQKITIEAKLKF